MIIELWDIWMEEILGKEEAAQQQKRKAMAAIMVSAPHNEQDQAHSSNSFLFYQDL